MVPSETIQRSILQATVEKIVNYFILELELTPVSNHVADKPPLYLSMVTEVVFLTFQAFQPASAGVEDLATSSRQITCLR